MTRTLKPGDYVQLVSEPWHQHAGDVVVVTKVDEDGEGFDFVIPEQRGHCPLKLVEVFL